VRFQVRQRIAAPVADVADALCDPEYYVALGQAPKLGVPEVLDREVDGDEVVMRIRYRFSGNLSSAARAVLDPQKLTWVEESHHDLGAHTVRFELQPDHYADRLSCRGRYQLVADQPDDGSTIRTVEGDLKVRAPLVGSSVEKALVSGLREHLDAEAEIVATFVNGP
jgi:uncharacterized protein DUF2505